MLHELCTNNNFVENINKEQITLNAHPITILEECLFITWLTMLAKVLRMIPVRWDVPFWGGKPLDLTQHS